VTTADRAHRPNRSEVTVPAPGPQLTSAEGAATAGSPAGAAADRQGSLATTTQPTQTGETPSAGSPSAVDSAASGAAPVAGRPRPQPAAGSGATAFRGPRRARLLVRRVDPWSALKMTLCYSLCLLVVLLVAVGALYAVLSAMGVFDSINTAVRDLTDSGGPGATGGLQVIFSARRVLLWTALLGLANVVLLSALATLAAFLYNLCADMVGGVEVTLAEQD